MNYIEKFEYDLAKYFNSPFAVCTDSCTHAIELCLRLVRPTLKITVPARTYISVPFTLIKLSLDWQFKDIDWENYYYLNGTNIIDAAVYFQKDSYVKNSLMCLSFQHKKALSLGRGGAILCSKKQDYDLLKRMAWDGRDHTKLWKEQDIDVVGYHYYMTPETAKLGSKKLKDVIPKAKQGSSDYPYLPEMKVFKQKTLK
tara:strand:- start:876 stop:1472 length:597 start_codon:yes stop_codon:yes gene_type:complete